MKQPTLNRVPLRDVVPLRPGTCYITLNPGQWDGTLAGAYEAGWVLLELDENEQPVRAYRRPHRHSRK
ncbi:MAG: hypothetical protein U0792_00605 [Gemmataceae bacterium]